MEFVVLLLAAVALAVILPRYVGFRSQRPADLAAQSPRFDLRTHLSGPILCEGVIYGPLGRVSARFVAEMEGEFLTVLQSPAPMEGLRSLMQARLDVHRTREDGQLWAEITAAAQRKPEIGQAACDMETQIAAYLNRIFAAETGLSEAEITARFPAHAAFAITLFKSAAMLPPTAEPIRADLTALIQRAIDTTMSDILALRKA